jgi:Arm DNA-binding domain
LSSSYHDALPPHPGKNRWGNKIMAIHRLSLRFVETVKQDGMYADGDKLYLQVRMGGKAKSWIFRYVLDGREHSMGLGPLHVVSLAEAREKARPLRQQLLEGIDPLAARSARRLQQRFDAARQVTFRQCAEGWMKGQEAGWSPENAHNYKRRFEKYVYPHTSTTATCRSRCSTTSLMAPPTSSPIS